MSLLHRSMKELSSLQTRLSLAENAVKLQMEACTSTTTMNGLQRIQRNLMLSQISLRNLEVLRRLLCMNSTMTRSVFLNAWEVRRLCLVGELLLSAQINTLRNSIRATFPSCSATPLQWLMDLTCRMYAITWSGLASLGIWSTMINL